MSTTTSTYLSVENNLARYQKLEASKGAVKTATAYYQANIGKVASIDQVVGNYRLRSYALQAYGLGDQVNNTALIKKVLQQGVTSSTALANTLPNQNWKAFATAFNFANTGASSPTSSTSVATTTGDYVEQQLESDQGQSDPGVELALYFKRVAPTITNSYSILADTNLLEVVQTIFGLPSTSSASQIDKQAVAISKLAPIADLQDPKKLTSLVERFTAQYDDLYGPGGANAGTPLTVKNGNTTATTPAAISILNGALTNATASNFATVLTSLALGG